MEPIVTLTLNPAVDANTSVEVVTPERKLRCEAPRYEPGGGGLNVSRVLARLDVASHALYLAGGPHGELLAQLLDEADFDRTALPIEGATREHLIVLERSSGRQFRFGLPGPHVTEAEWRRCLEALETLRPHPTYVVVSGSLPPGLPDDAVAQVADRVRTMGARLVLDTSGTPLRHGVEAGVSWIKPNLAEFQALVGEELPHDRDQQRAARRLLEAGRVEGVLLSLGAGGALLVTAQGAHHLPSPVVPIRSKVGAGDSMVAGLVAGLARGWTPLEAARLGVAAGAAAVMTEGTELSHADDVRTLYADLAAQA